MRFEKIQLYENRPDVTLRAYLISDSPELLAGKTRPAIIICPGGAYVNCCEREAEPVALRFMAMGYHAFVLNYSVVTQDPNPYGKELEFDEKTLFPAQIRDMGKAFLAIREHAEEWFVNPEQIIICGFSAGGHLCASYSVYWDQPVLTDYFGVSADMLKPAASILSYPVIDYKLWSEKKMESWEVLLQNASRMALLGTTSLDEETNRKISPNYLVSQSTPPTFLWTTREDALVQPKHALLMATALEDAGRPYEFHVFSRGPHGLSLAKEASSGAKEQIYPDVSQWIDLAEKWLSKYFTLDLKDVIIYE